MLSLPFVFYHGYYAFYNIFQPYRFDKYKDPSSAIAGFYEIYPVGSGGSGIEGYLTNKGYVCDAGKTDAQMYKNNPETQYITTCRSKGRVFQSHLTVLCNGELKVSKIYIVYSFLGL